MNIKFQGNSMSFTSSMSKNFFRLSVLAVCLACGSWTHGDTITWTAGSGTWETAANWSTGTVPTTSDDVTFTSTGTPYTVTFNNNKVSTNAAKSVTIPTGVSLVNKYGDFETHVYVEDNTNRDEEISRNRIRHSVIPQLESINPQFLDTNARTRKILQQQYAYYQEHIAADIRKVASEQNGQCRINRSKLAECDDQELVLYEILNDYGFPAIVSEKLSVNSFFQPGKQFFSDTHILLIDRDFLLIQPKANSKEACVNISSQEELSQYFDMEEFEYQKNMVFDKNPDILYIPKDKLTFPLQIRSWRSGDYFYPLGTKGRQKLSDFFTDHKIDRFTKSRIRLLCSEDQIIWIIGWRSDDRFKIQEKNTICYKICNRKL